MIGERVRHARLYHGWSQSKLAELVNVSQPAISQIEKTGAASEETVVTIAKVTGFTPAFFRRGPLPDLPEGTLRFRKRASSTVKDDERIRAHVKTAIELLDLWGAIAKPPPVLLRPLAPSDKVDDDRIEDLALEVREVFGIGAFDPIPNLIRAVERSGVAVVGSVDEVEKHDGASYWPNFPEGRPIISFTRGMPGDRQRLTVAHEVGHLLLHQLRSVSVKDAETEAYRFGAALLIPIDAALQDIETPVTLRGLAFVKARWGISVRALIRRCLDLRLIDESRRLSLEKQMSARGWRKEEPVHVPEEEPVMVRRVIELATGQRKSSALANELGIPPHAVRALLG